MESNTVSFEEVDEPRIAPRTPALEDLISGVLKSLGENPERDGLRQTPARVARSLSFLTGGYWDDPKEVVNGAVFENDSDEMAPSPRRRIL